MSAVRAYIDLNESGHLESKDQSFTLCPRKARSLLAEYQFSKPGDFLLKFVQASTLAANGLTIIGNQTFEFWGWNKRFLRTLVRRMQRPLGRHKDDALSYLAQGLLNLAIKQDLLLELFPQDEAKGQVARINLSSLSTTEVSKIARPPQIAEGHGLLRVTLSRPYLELAVLRRFVEDRCPWSRIRFEENPAHEGRHTLSALRSLRSDNSIPHHAQWRQDLPGWFVVEGQKLSKYAKLRLFKHGVMLEEVILTGHIGPTVSLCADHLKTDLSGLSFIHEQAYADAVQRGREVLSSSLVLASTTRYEKARHLSTRLAYLSGLLGGLSLLF